MKGSGIAVIHKEDAVGRKKQTSHVDRLLMVVGRMERMFLQLIDASQLFFDFCDFAEILHVNQIDPDRIKGRKTRHQFPVDAGKSISVILSPGLFAVDLRQVIECSILIQRDFLLVENAEAIFQDLLCFRIMSFYGRP